MKYNKLIKECPNISEIGMGAWQLGARSGWKEMTEHEAIELVQTSVEMGVNFFDTAPNYGLGTSELRLGKALKAYDRDMFVVNTKFGHNDTGGTDFDPNTIQKSLDGSLKRLQMEYVDSLIIHNPPYEYLDGYKNDHYEILEKLKDSGKIKGYGASLDTYKEIELLLKTTNSKVIEIFFNILHQDAAKSFDLAKEKNVGIIVKIPLDSGWLTGKYNEDSIFEGVRRRWSKADIKTRAMLVNRVKNIIGYEANLTQTALSFCLAYEAVSAVIPGTISTQQLKDNITHISQPISKPLLKKLEIFYQDEVKHLNIPW
jgi:aryl-alcohol dehydrogenase-like predicted oxidoreductase